MKSVFKIKRKMENNSCRGSADEKDAENNLLGKVNDDRKSFQLDSSLVACGVGPCKPSWVQRLSTIKAFTANVCIVILLYTASFGYMLGTVRTIEKRFGFKSVTTGSILSAVDTTTTCLVIFVGYIGDRAHKPRIFSVMMSLIGISKIFFLAGSYFYLSPSTEFHETEFTGDNVTETLLCVERDTQDEPRCEEDQKTREGSDYAYCLFLLGGILTGIGGSSTVSMVFGYIDENVNKEDSAVYLGIAMAAFPFGPVLGFGLAGFTLTLPENLVDPPFERSDPRFIGAWWLGFLILGIAILVACIPVFFFPKHLPKYYLEKHKKLKTMRGTKKQSNVTKQLKEFFVSIWKLVSKPAFITLLLASVCSVYIIQVAANLPRYLEIHFRLSASSANIITGMVGAFSAVLGNLLAGWFMKRSKMTPTKAAIFYCVSLFVSIIGLIALMLIPCAQPVIAGAESGGDLELSMLCNSNCTCDRLDFDPVCGSNGVSHFSPCYAGCDHEFGNESYGGCECADTRVVSPGMCEEPCGNIVVYGIIMFITIFCGATGEVPGTVLLLRVAGEKQKSLALGVIGFFINVIGFVPGPVIYGSLFDSSCLLWAQQCSGTGFCLHYDIEQLRMKLHGVTAIFIFAALVFTIATYFLVRKLPITFEDEEGTDMREQKNVNEN